MLTNLLHLMFGGGDTTNIVELTAFRIVAIIAIPVGIAGALASSVAAGLGGAVGAAWTSTHRYAARLFGTLGIAAGIWISRTCLDYTIDKYNSGQTGDSTGLFTSLHFQAYCGPSVLGWIGSIVIFAVGFAILWKSTIPSLNPSQSDSSKPDGNIPIIASEAPSISANSTVFLSDATKSDFIAKDLCPLKVKAQALASAVKQVLPDKDCPVCGHRLRRLQIETMVGNPEYNEWAREGFCSLNCFETSTTNLNAQQTGTDNNNSNRTRGFIQRPAKTKKSLTMNVSKCRFWLCPSCNGVIEKQDLKQRIEDYSGPGEVIVRGTTECGNCHHVYQQQDVYAGNYDLPRQYWAEIEAKSGKPVELPPNDIADNKRAEVAAHPIPGGEHRTKPTLGVVEEPAAQRGEHAMQNVSKMDRFCIVCEKVLGPHANGCCTPSSLVATRERGFFKKTREFYDLQGALLDDTGMAAVKKAERENHQRIQREAAARQAAEDKRKVEIERQRQLDELKQMSVCCLERLLRNTKKERRFSAFLGTATEDDVFELQDAERRRAAINILSDIPSEDAVTALRNVMADQEDPPRVYSPSRGMKIDELELIRSILQRRRDKNAVVIKCPKCKAELDITPQAAGTQVTCKNCRHTMLAPSDKTPDEWATRLTQAKDWTGLLEPLSHTEHEQDQFDPWFYQKQCVACEVLQVVGVPIISPIIELVIQKLHKKGYCSGLGNVYKVLLGIGDPSTGPLLKLIADNDSTLSATPTTHDKVKAFIAKNGSAPCDEDLLCRLSSAYGKKAGKSTSDSCEKIGEWQMIGGQRATALAESAGVARPGTFSAAALSWIGSGRAPFSVAISGTITCAYCNTATDFSLDAMSGQVRCSGCCAVYSLFNTDKEIDGKDGRIVAASVFSHTQGTPVRVPQINIICGKKRNHTWDGCKCSKCEETNHSWDGCKCSKCGKIRDEEHVWDGCKCSRCGRTRDADHAWDGCQCCKCGKTRNEEHSWRFCKCSRCGDVRDEEHVWNGCQCNICGKKRNHTWDGCKCSKCEETNHSWDGCKCSKCGKCSTCGEGIHDWSKDSQLCAICGITWDELPAWDRHKNRSRILLGNQSSGGDTKTQKDNRSSQRTGELPALSSFSEVKGLLSKLFIPNVEGALRQYWLTPDELCDIAEKYADLIVVTCTEYSCGNSDNMYLISFMDKKAPQSESVGFFGLYKFSQDSDYAKMDRLAQVAPAAYVKALPELAGIRGQHILNFNGQDGRGEAKGQDVPPAELRERLRRRRESIRV